MLYNEGFAVYKIEGGNKIFRDHKIRHDLAKFLDLLLGLIESIQKYEENKDVKSFNTGSEFWDSLLNVANIAVKALEPLMESSKRIKDLEEFNINKNNGFYVDFRYKLLVPSEEINK